MVSKEISSNTNPIDVVITWVDGNSSDFIKKMESHLQGVSRNKQPGAHKTRFASINEIRYCLISILRFAPFVRKIFIVTDNQDPNLYSDIEKYFPEKLNDIRIVDHTQIFEGFEQHLPTFSSRSIEFMMWRIIGLSDNFVYFNDDLFLVREVTPSDWFVNNKPVLRGNWVPLPVFRLMWNFIRLKIHRNVLGDSHYLPRPSYNIGQWTSASQLGYIVRYFKAAHTPLAINRKMLEDYFSQNILQLEQNISFRFRRYDQPGFAAFSNHLELMNKNFQIVKPELAYLQPSGRIGNYIDKKLRQCEKDSTVKFMCVQSLELCPKDQQTKIFDWMKKILEIE